MITSVQEEGLTWAQAAARFQVSVRTVAKWLARARTEGTASLRDRSSRPHSSPRQTPTAQVAVVLSLRRLRMPGFQIARQTGLSKATVSRLLARHGLSSLAALEPPVPVIRYQREHPGELLHLDIKQLPRILRPGQRVTGNRRQQSRGGGYEYVHVAIDDRSRLAFAQVLPDQTTASARLFLRNALAHFARLGITIQRLMTDNGAAYRSHRFAAEVQALQLRHRFTKPYTPRTNGKAERFIQTSLREWAYAAVYQTSALRTEHLAHWIHRYNWHRPHSALNHQPPISILHLPMNNLLSLHM
jgi:transposase InsO family protein